MNIPLRLIYQFLKFVVRVVLGVFYTPRTTVNPANLQLDGPAILVSNHPNTLIDPLAAALRINRQVFFLANASLFKTPFQNWFFNTFYCIPVERPEDTQGRPIQNKQNFARADRHLGGGGVLYIAPEGYSFKGRKLLKLKTGTARIAFSAEAVHGFELGIKILPVGLNYSAPYQFRSELLVHAGPPLEVKAFADQYSEDPVEAVRSLTLALEAQLRSLILDTQDEKEDRLLAILEAILQVEQPLAPREAYFRSQDLLAALQRRRRQNETDWGQFAAQVASYQSVLKKAGLSDANVACPGSCGLLRRTLGALATGPVFLYGWINNYLPGFLPAFAVRKLKLDEEYDGTVKAVAGLVTFPVFYGLQFLVVRQFFPLSWSFIYLLSLAPFGLLAWHLKEWYSALSRDWRWQQFRRKQPDEVRKLTRIRKEILAAIDFIRE